MQYNEYSILQAVADGVLLDVSHIAAKLGHPYPAFITSAFWNSVDIHRMECRVLLALEGAVFTKIGERLPEMGTFHLFVSPNLERWGWPKAACPWMLPLSITLVPSKRFGVIIFICGQGETIDFRSPRTASGGSFYTM